MRSRAGFGSRYRQVTLAASCLCILVTLQLLWTRAQTSDLLGALGVPTCSPRGVMIHHTGTPDVIGGKPVDERLLERMHRLRGFSTIFAGRRYHIGYHYVILSDGSLRRGRPEHCQGAHAGSTVDNRKLIGIAVVGNFRFQQQSGGRVSAHGSLNSASDDPDPTRSDAYDAVWFLGC